MLTYRQDGEKWRIDMKYEIVFSDGEVEIVEDVTYAEAVNIGVAIVCNTNKASNDFDVYEIEDDEDEDE